MPCLQASLQETLEEIEVLVRPHLGKGATADYIPALGQIPVNKFGIAVRAVTGEEASVGDADEPFSIQSIAKVFALGIALNRRGDEVWLRVGKEPSGTPFNFLAQLEAEKGIPRNPFVNSGALVITDMLMSISDEPALLMRDFASVLAGDSLLIDDEVARSEIANASKNLAIAHILKLHGTIEHTPDGVVQHYCRQCALAMTCRQLSRAFLPLSASGHSSVLGETVYTPKLTRRINSLLLMCGVYDSVGNFAYRVGFPAKSGVGGGIVAVIPGRCTIAVWSPGLDRFGNSLVGTLALEQFAQLTGWSIL